MIWQGTSLIDGQGSHLASSTDATIVYATHELRIVTDSATDFRAVDERTGEEYRLWKVGLTVSRYAADCAGRRYSLNRVGHRPRREIRALDGGEIVAVTRGRLGGELEVRPRRPLDADLGLDLVFMSWGLTHVDTPTRRTLY